MKETYSMRARIDTLDNGCTMVIRRHETPNSVGIVVLKRVYTDMETLIKDLEQVMKFNWSKK